MKDRVRQIMDHFQMSQMQFANELAVAPATISNIYKGKTAPTNNLVQSIHQAFPSVSINWLLFGEGEMLLPLSPEGSRSPSSVAPSPTDEPSLFDIPSPQQPLPKSGKNEHSDLATNMQILEVLTELKHACSAEPSVRKIKEIRVFYDDGTYESFGPNR